MTGFENLLKEAANEKVAVFEKYDLSGTRFQGLYCDGSVALDKNIESEVKKACVLAEELGHHYTTIGDITDQKKAANRKQEQQARTWAYNKMIGLMGIVNAFKAGCRNRYEMAEYLNVTEEFLADALERYRQKYSPYTSIDNYIIYFEPCIAVMEIQKN